MVKPEEFPVNDPGLIVQLPAGRPLKSILPVARLQSGCVTEPATGAEGVTGCAFITTLADPGEVHPAKLVTVNEYDPGAIPDMVLLVPVPVMAPGLIVQFPAGSPFTITVPVATAQVGCVMAPIIGVAGVTG